MSLDILNEGQVYGKDKLSMFGGNENPVANHAAVSDYAGLTGVFVSERFFVNDEESLENRAGAYWLKRSPSSPNLNDVPLVSRVGSRDYRYANDTSVGVRLASLLSNITFIATSEASGYLADRESLCTIADKEIAKDIKKALKCGRTKSIKLVGEQPLDGQIKGTPIYEFEDGKKYGCTIAKPYKGLYLATNGQKFRTGDEAWCEVDNIRGQIDEDPNTGLNIFVSDLILAQARYNDEWAGHKTFKKNTLHTFLGKLDAACSIGSGVSQMTEQVLIEYEGQQMLITIPEESTLTGVKLVKGNTQIAAKLTNQKIDLGKANGRR